MDEAVKKLEEIEARRAARKTALEAQRREQLAQDLEALDQLEVEHGDHAVVRVDLQRYEPGLPTMVVMRLPKPIEFKRYQDQCKKDVTAATNLIGDVCRLYPDEDTYKRMRSTFTGVHVMAAVAAINAASAKEQQEGKE